MMKKLLCLIMAVSMSIGSLAAIPETVAAEEIAMAKESAGTEKATSEAAEEAARVNEGNFGKTDDIDKAEATDKGSEISEAAEEKTELKEDYFAATTGDGFEYSVSNNRVTITGYSGSATTLSIPSQIDGKPVTSIGEYAFDFCNSLTSIEIPDSVTSIGDRAFYDCRSLTSVDMGKNVTSIGSYAFDYCTSLTNISIPDSVTSIGRLAFSSCKSLASIEIPDSVTSIGELAFYNCSSLTSIVVDPDNTIYDSRNTCNAIIETNNNTLIAGANTTIIPDSVTSIGSYAFDGCTGLTSIEIPNSVTSIGDSAFSGCSSLTSITIPNSVTSIGEWAFEDCSSLTGIAIPDSVKSIGDEAFGYCNSLTSICFESDAPSIGSDAFRGVTATAFYPSNNGTWTSSIKQNYGGNITWTTKTPEDSGGAIYDVVVTLSGSSTVSGDYKDLHEAYNAAISVNEAVTLTMKKDVTIGSPLYSSSTIPTNVKGITFDLNDCTITVEGGNYFLRNKTPLTITDTGTEHRGTVQSSVMTTNNGLIYHNVAKDMVIEAGTFIANGKYVVNASGYQEANVIIYSGVFKNTDGGTTIRANTSNIRVVSGEFYGAPGNRVTIEGEKTGDDSHWVVTKSQLAEVTANGAKAEYYSLYDALLACVGSTDAPVGGEVYLKLLRDISISDRMILRSGTTSTDATTRAITFDANGHTVTASQKNGLEIINKNTTLRLTGNGTWIVPDDGYFFTGNNGSVLIVESGTFIGAREYTSGKQIVGTGSVSCSITGGKFYVDPSVYASGIIVNTGADDEGDYWTVGMPPVTLGVSEDFEYNVSDNQVTITKYNGSATSLSIPGEIDGMPVISIGEYAFDSCNSLTSITIPDSVTSIGSFAFYGCSSLTSIKIPDSVTSIGYGAFCDCSSLTSTTIPDSVTSIGEWAFEDCSSLTSIEIPDSVTSIGDGAFYGCSSLTSITIPDSVTSIGNFAFYDCSSLTSILFKGDAPSICSNAFYGVTATAYYPADNTTWTTNAKQNYGGNIKWAQMPAYIAVGETKNADVTSGGEYAFFYFQPEQTGTYVFYSSSNSDTYGYIYDENMNQFSSNDDSGEGNNFKVSYTMTAGTKYILGARYYNNSDTGSFDVTVEKQLTVYEDDPLHLELISDEHKEVAFTPTESGYYVIYGENYSTDFYPLEFDIRDSSGVWVNSKGNARKQTAYLYKDAKYLIDVGNSGMGSDGSLDLMVSKAVPATGIIQSEGGTIEAYLSDSMLRVGFSLSPWNAVEEDISWSSANNDIASFSYSENDSSNEGLLLHSGWFYLNSVGQTTITATTESGLSASWILDVKPCRVISEGETVKFSHTYVSYSFTPAESGYYQIFGSNSLSWGGWYVTEIFDKDGIPVGGNYVYWDDKAYVFAAVANETYTINITNEGEFDISLSKIEYTPISLNETKSVENGSWFLFTPAEDGRYAFYSTGDSDTVGYVYDESLSELDHDNDDGDRYNFKIVYDMKSGTNYMLRADFLDDEKEKSPFDVRIEKFSSITSIDIVSAPENWYYYIDDNGDTIFGALEDEEYDKIAIRATYSDGKEVTWNYADRVFASIPSFEDGGNIGFKGPDCTEVIRFTPNSVITDGKCTVVFEIGSVSAEMILTPINIEDIIDSVEIAEGSLTLIENQGGYWEWDDNEEEYFHYCYSLSEADIYIKTNYKDGTSRTFEYGEEVHGYCADANSNQYENHWTLGSDNYITISYLGAEMLLPVTIIENPVESIELAEGSLTLIENCRGYWEWDDNEEEYFRYWYSLSEADINIKINYKDGTSRTFEYGEQVHGYWPDDNDDQYEEHWTLGSDNYITISYLGAEALLPVTIIENPVDHIELVAAPQRKYVQYDMTYGHIEELDVDSPWWWDIDNFDLTDMLLKVYYTDGTEGTYTYEDIPNRAYFYVFSEIDYDQDSDCHIGENSAKILYYGKEADFSYTIIESPVAGIEIISVPERDSEYYRLFDFRGVVLKIDYTDGTSSTVTLSDDNYTGDFASMIVHQPYFEVDGYTGQIWSGGIFFLGAECDIAETVFEKSENKITKIDVLDYELLSSDSLFINSIRLTFDDGTTEIIRHDGSVGTIGTDIAIIGTDKGLLQYDVNGCNDGVYSVRMFGFDMFVDTNPITGTCGTKATWTLSGGTFTISGTGAMTNFASKTAMPWYEYIDEIEEIIVDDGITSIGNYSFAGCTNLTSVTLGNTVSSIGVNAFSGCANLSSISLPASLTSISNYAFNNCSALSLIEFNSSTAPTLAANALANTKATAIYKSSWTKFDKNKFGGKTTWLVDHINGSCGATKYSLDRGVMTISGKGTIRGYSKGETPWYSYRDEVQTINIGSGVTAIGNYAFYGCENLTDLTLGNGVTNIGTSAFYGCTSLDEVSFPASLTNLGSYAFSNCSSLAELTFNGETAPTIASTALNTVKAKAVHADNESWNAFNKTGFGGAIYWTDDPEEEIIGGSCGNQAAWMLIDGTLTIYGEKGTKGYSKKTDVPWYEYREQITKIVVEDGITSLGNYQFMGCENVTEVYLSNTLTFIGVNAFSTCSKLTTITIPATVNTINGYAFNKCSSLQNVIFEGNKPATLAGTAFANTTVKP